MRSSSNFFSQLRCCSSELLLSSDILKCLIRLLNTSNIEGPETTHTNHSSSIRIYYEIVKRIVQSVPRVTVWHYEALLSSALRVTVWHYEALLSSAQQICLSIPQRSARFSSETSWENKKVYSVTLFSLSLIYS